VNQQERYFELCKKYDELWKKIETEWKRTEVEMVEYLLSGMSKESGTYEKIARDERNNLRLLFDTLYTNVIHALLPFVGEVMQKQLLDFTLELMEKVKDPHEVWEREDRKRCWSLSQQLKAIGNRTLQDTESRDGFHTESDNMDNFYPIGWFKENTIIPPSRLRQAAKPDRKKKQVRSKNVSGSVVYSLKDVEEHWPHDIRIKQ